MKNFNMTGTIFWEKLRGDPQPGYDEDKNEWSVDFTPNQKGLDLLKRIGLGEKLRSKDDDREDFITFRRPELKKDGTANGHVEVVDAEGNPFPEEKLIGNGTGAKVKFGVLDLPARGKFKAFIKPVLYKVTITNLVEFQRKAKVSPDKADGASTEAASEVSAQAGTTKPARKPAAKDGWQDQEETE